MAVITPQTDVILLKVPLEIDNNNQLTFANATAQYNYFNSLPKLVMDEFTYQRKDGTIRFPAKFDDLLEYNYVMYRNEGYSNKWFYAYITSMEYINDGMTAVHIKTDTWQTWQFSLTYKKVFVEREHVNDDTIGAHTLDEGLDLGEYVINSSTTLKPNRTVKDYNGNTITGLKFPIVFQVSELASGIAIATSMFESSYNGVFSGLYYFAVTSYTDARSVITRYASQGKSGSIVSIFLAPVEFLEGSKVYGELGYNLYIPQDASGSVTTLLNETTITRPSTLNGYTPKNNRLFCYPFSYMYVTNNVGSNAEFRYEDFTNATPKFFMAGALGQECTTKLCPTNYKSHGNSEVFEYGMIGAKYPVCAWASDYYTNWLAQNGGNVASAVFTGVASNVVGIASSKMWGNPAGIASSSVGLLGSIFSTMAEINKAKTIPDQAQGNIMSSDILIGWQRYFTVDCMSIRAEIASVCDDYLSMFGYKVNKVKTPNITGRRNWNYVKTVGCYIEADIPQDDLQEIKTMFDKGITFWHSPTTFMDYSQNNDII